MRSHSAQEGVAKSSAKQKQFVTLKLKSNPKFKVKSRRETDESDKHEDSNTRSKSLLRADLVKVEPQSGEPASGSKILISKSLLTPAADKPKTQSLVSIRSSRLNSEDYRGQADSSDKNTQSPPAWPPHRTSAAHCGA